MTRFAVHRSSATRGHALTSVLAILAVATAGLLVVPAARADSGDPPTPPEIAQHCIIRNDAQAAHRAEANAAIAAACAEQVSALVEAGALEQAQALAQHCIHLVGHRSLRAIRRIERRADRCAFVLFQMQAPALAVLVQTEAAEAQGVVVTSAQAARQAILAALGG